jgi:hypothetical protein
MKIVFSLFILIALGCNSNPEKNRIDETAISLIDTFFKTIKANHAEYALDELLKTNPNISPKDSATLNLKNNFSMINNVSGFYVSYRLLKKRFLRNDIGIYSYLAKYEKRFYRFVFIFYNNDKNVKLYSFLFDDSLGDELEGSLKYYVN